MADVSGIADYLASLRKRRWQPGVLDCGVLMADWAVILGLRDPIADIRGSYSSERQFLRIIRREGGFVACCAARLRAVGFREIQKGSAGDLLIVLAPYAERGSETLRRPTGAICVSPTMRAVVTSDIGIVIADEKSLPTLKVWTI